MNPQIKIPKKIEGFLEKAGIKYELVGHRTVYTAFDKAATLKVKHDAIAKVLTLKIGKETVLAVVGGNRNMDIEKLKKVAKADEIGFVKEKIIAETFKGIDPGAIPPFANLWQARVFCDKKMLECSKIIISAGTYEASIIITAAVFKKINPEMIIGNFSIPRPKPKPKKKITKPEKRQ